MLTRSKLSQFDDYLIISKLSGLWIIYKVQYWCACRYTYAMMLIIINKVMLFFQMTQFLLWYWMVFSDRPKLIIPQKCFSLSFANSSKIKCWLFAVLGNWICYQKLSFPLFFSFFFLYLFELFSILGTGFLYQRYTKNTT